METTIQPMCNDTYAQGSITYGPGARLARGASPIKSRVKSSAGWKVPPNGTPFCNSRQTSEENTAAKAVRTVSLELGPFVLDFIMLKKLK